MKTKAMMRQALTTAKEHLQQYGFIYSPAIKIIAKGSKPIAVQPICKDEESKKLAANENRKLCQRIKAQETIILSDVFVHSKEGKPTRDALYVAAENKKRIYKVVLPYKFKADGTVQFGKEDWSKEMKKNKQEFGRYEGIVQ